MMNLHLPNPMYVFKNKWETFMCQSASNGGSYYTLMEKTWNTEPN